MPEFARQMERKQGRPAKIFPDHGAGATDLDFPLEIWVKAVAGREPRAPGNSGMLTAALKQLTTGSIASLQSIVRSRGTLPYIRIVYSDLVGYQTSDIRLLWTIITKP